MGSFIKAAHRLEIPRASVSAAVQQLEAKLGTRLLHRTTRQVRPTADGLKLLERLRRLLADAEDIDQLFVGSEFKVAGRLNVDMPTRIARRLVAPSLPDLLRRHPGLQVALSSTDRVIDLVREGMDCAVRVGALRESNLAVRPIGRLALVNCASPDYLEEHGAPRHPDDLGKGHWSVGYASPSTGREVPWEFLCSGEERSAEVPCRVIVNSAENYIACCLAGLGLIQIPRFDVEQLLDSGRLVEVMPDFRAAPMPVSLVYPHRRQRTHRLGVFIDWFAALMRPHLEP